MQEQELVKQLQQGSREAFDRIYLLYHRQAYRTAFFLTGNRADAQDVVQETFGKVWLCAPQLKDRDGFRSWFYRILTRMAFRKGSAKKGRFRMPIFPCWPTGAAKEIPCQACF